jgi:hypothetical protein
MTNDDKPTPPKESTPTKEPKSPVIFDDWAMI